MRMIQRHRALLLLTALCLLCLTACGGTSSGQNQNGTPPANATATTPPKAKPTGVPALTVAYCTGLMSLTEANQIMQPATAATSIQVDKGGTGGGSCNWEYDSFHSTVTVLFESYPQGTSLDAIVAQSLAAVQNAPGAKTSKTTVTGVGDQAFYITVSAQVGTGIWEDVLATTYGSVYISCLKLGSGAPPAASLQQPLTQVCQQVISRM